MEITQGDDRKSQGATEVLRGDAKSEWGFREDLLGEEISRTKPER